MIVITLSRKFMNCPVTENVLKWGTGRLNLDSCRIDSIPLLTGTINGHAKSGASGIYGPDKRTTRQQDYDIRQKTDPKGRFSSNVILNHMKQCKNGYCISGCPVSYIDEESIKAESTLGG